MKRGLLRPLYCETPCQKNIMLSRQCIVRASPLVLLFMVCVFLAACSSTRTESATKPELEYKLKSLMKIIATQGEVTLNGQMVKAPFQFDSGIVDASKDKQGQASLVFNNGDRVFIFQARADFQFLSEDSFFSVLDGQSEPEKNTNLRRIILELGELRVNTAERTQLSKVNYYLVSEKVTISFKDSDVHVVRENDELDIKVARGVISISVSDASETSALQAGQSVRFTNISQSPSID